MKNYLEIKITDPDTQFMMIKVFSAVHAFISQIKKEFPSEKIGITFPFWESDHIKTDIGDVIRVFATANILEKINEFDGFKFLIKCRAVKIYSIKETPIVNKYIRFSRERTIEKNSIIHLIKKDKLYQEKNIDNPKEARKFIKKKIILDNIYYLKLHSKSTDQKSFSLFIKAKEVTKLSESFSTYGLSNSLDKDMGLPYF